MGVIIIVFRARDFINVGAVLKVKSTLGGVVQGGVRRGTHDSSMVVKDHGRGTNMSKSLQSFHDCVQDVSQNRHQALGSSTGTLNCYTFLC